MEQTHIFKRSKMYNLPGAYKDIIGKNDYNLLLDIAKRYHHEKNLLITNITDGEIVTEINGEEQHRYLDTLVKILSANEKDGWETLIYSHFDKLKTNNAAYNYLLKDFDYASQFLRVLIKGDGFDFGGGITDFIYRSDFPHTNTFLVLEFEEQFKYLRYQDIKEWGKETNTLFNIAIANIPFEEIEVKEFECCHKFPVYTFFSSDYSSSIMLDLQNRAEFSIGSYGSLISIPAKGTAFAHPIESENIMELVEKLNPVIEQFHKEEPGNITTNFYWYYGGNIEMFPKQKEGPRSFIYLPDDLIKIFSD